MIDLIECESVFSNRKESESTKEHKRIKNIIMNIILNNTRLSNREVEVYKLFYRENLSHDEIAIALGVTVKTSMNHLSKATFKINKISYDIATNFQDSKKENKNIKKKLKIKKKIQLKLFN